jgi:lysozyme family protein
MAQGNFKAALAVTLTHEGGWSDHPRDPGGATMKGVTLATFRQFRPGADKDDLRAISSADVERIYRDGYWTPVRGDDLPHGVDLAVFDFGVNSGPGRAVRHLQAVVVVPQDGTVGPMTLNAVGTMRGDVVVQKLCARRLSFVRALSTWDVFGRGWARRIADIEARSVAMWLAVNTTPRSAKMSLQAEADRAVNTARTQTTGAGAAGAGGAAGGAADVSTDPSMLLIGAAVLLVAGAVLWWRGRVNRDRAAAYRVVASEVRG